MRIAFMAVAALFMLPSCDRGVVYYEYSHTPITGWEKNDTLFFDVPKVKEPGTYRVDIGLRTNESFPFTRLSLVVEQAIEPGHRVQTDTIDCRLADEKGNKLGQGISYSQYKFILSDINLHAEDSLHICVRHIMKREILPGISDIGLKITRK